MSNRNQKIEIGITEAEIRIEATQLTINIVTALGSAQSINHPPNLNPKIPRPHREEVVDILSNNEVTKYLSVLSMRNLVLFAYPHPQVHLTGGTE